MSERVKCPICGFVSNPSGLSQHMKQHEKQPAATTMLSRKMNKLLSEKKRNKAMMIDLSSHHGEIPQPTSESENLKSMLKHLNEIRMVKFPNTIARVREVLMARRLRHKNNFWRRQFYNQFGVKTN